MKRTTIFVDESLESDLEALARREGRPVAAVVREALTRYVEGRRRGAVRTLSFLAIGRSGHRDTAEGHEAWLWRDLSPHGRVEGSGRRTPPRAKTGRRRRRRLR